MIEGELSKEEQEVLNVSIDTQINDLISGLENKNLWKHKENNISVMEERSEMSDVNEQL